MGKRLNAIDPENPPMTDEELASLRPAREVLPPELFARLTKRKPGQRGPGVKPARELVSLRLSPDTVKVFKAGNKIGWRDDIRAIIERAAVRRTKAKPRVSG